MSYQNYWSLVKKHLREHPEIDERKFELYFEPTRFLFQEENRVYIRAPKVLAGKLNNMYGPKINEIAQKIFLKDLEFIFKPEILDEEVDTFSTEEVDYTFNKMREKSLFVEDNNLGVNLIPRYNFENFVEGEKNKLAYATALAVANNPGKLYNPLFIYGGVGLGKTHLLHAIGNKLKQDTKDPKVMLISIEQFVNDFIDSIKTGRTKDFKNRYRSVDILMIDDIQFLKDKESTQEEFHHTFNVLYNLGKQIVIASDRKPQQISNLTDRLISRFNQGLIVDIQAPCYETRQAILRLKIQNEYDCYDINEFDDKVIDYIANHIKTNIRELEGALRKVIGYSSLYSKKPDLGMAEEALKGVVANEKVNVTVDMIIEAIAEYFKINVDDILNGDRRRNFAGPRQIAMYLSRKYTNCSFPEIGQKFGGKNHATVLYACRKISNKMENNTDFRHIIESLDDIFSKYVA